MGVEATRDDFTPTLLASDCGWIIIKEAIEAFLSEEPNAFWFKLYYAFPFLTTDDLDFVIDRQRKLEEAEEDWRLDLVRVDYKMWTKSNLVIP